MRCAREAQRVFMHEIFQVRTHLENLVHEHALRLAGASHGSTRQEKIA